MFKKQYIFAFLALGVCIVLFQNFGNWRRANPRSTPVNPQPTNPTQPTLPPSQPPGTSAQVRVYGYASDGEVYMLDVNKQILLERSVLNDTLSYCSNHFKQGTFIYRLSSNNANVTIVNVANSKGESIETLCHILQYETR